MIPAPDPDQHLSKLWVIDCCPRDGTVTFRRSGHKGRMAEAVPAWSTDTAASAELLIRLACQHQPVPHPRLDPRETWYVLPSVAKLARTNVGGAVKEATARLRDAELYLNAPRGLAERGQPHLSQPSQEPS